MKIKLFATTVLLILSISVFAISSPTNSAPANGSTNQFLAVTIDWSNVTGNAGYIYQLDTTPLFNSTLLREGPTPANSSQATMYDLYFGTTYYWRAATKSTVDTSAWSATWSFTTLVTFANVSPTNGATSQAVSVTIDWATVTGNSGYIYQIDTTPLFNSSLLREEATPINSSQATLYDLYFGTQYYWRAAAKTLVDTSDWSATWNFTTSDLVYGVSPTNGSSSQPVGLTIDWSSINGNTGYIYEYDTVSTFNSPMFVTGITAADMSQVYVSSLRFGQQYYWRVAAKNAVDTSAWSATWSFTTSDLVYGVSPTNGSSSQPVGLTIDWSSINGNTGYIYEYDTVSTFNSTVFYTGTTVADMSQVYVGSLRFGQQYYWRVAAKNAVDTSAWSATWSFTTSDLVYGVSPTNGSSSQPVGLTIDWSSINGNTGYIYEYDTVSTFNSPVFYTGTTVADMSQVYVGSLRFGQQYYWRVAAKNAVDTSAWSATWSFTTSDLVYGVSPTNGSSSQPVGLTIDWSSINGNTGYIYEYDTVSTFNSPMFVTGTTVADMSQVYVSSLRFGQQYYWRVAAKNAVDTSAWSSVWGFTTGDIVTNYTPANGATGISVNPTLDWSSFTGAIGYICRVDTTMNFNSPELQTYSGVNSTSGFAGLRYGTEYYWQAAARNDIDTSQWSVVWMFTTAFEMSTAPTLISPANSSLDISYLSVGLEWESIVSANTYQYQVSTNSGFTSLIYNSTTSLVTTNISGLNPYTVYYWRVRASNANGNSPWSSVWSFTTESADLTAPILVSPSNGATDVASASLFLDWNSVFGATAYVFEITEDENFVSGITTQQVSETFKEIIGLSDGTEYFWRVKATDGAVYSDWSEVWSFSTEIDGLDAPVLVSPLNNSTGVDFNIIVLNWNQVVGATEYSLEFSTDDTFESNVVVETVSTTEKTLIDLEENTQYFWRVKASNGTIESAWSEVWNFTTDEQIVYYTLTITIEGGG
ncbi:MAG: fibronectin type III domain-containing protein, partial [Bacteroidales bacterium]|nr:fibronectin type III domain-containing protein [Bacteroidales bacterium]